MASTTSGLTAFSMDVNELIDQALIPSGGEHVSGIDAVKARKVLNLLLIQLQNKNIPISKIDFVDQVLTSGTDTYTLDDSITDVLEVNIQLGTNSLAISRTGLKEYHKIPVKTQTGRPNRFTTERLNTTVDLILWPVPNLSTYTAKMLVELKIEDITAAYQRVDLPARYLPLLVKWLAYELALNRVGVPETTKDRLKAEYKEAYEDVVEEDRERADFTVRPGGISGR